MPKQLFLVMVVPITGIMPAMLVAIPPAVVGTPAVFAFRIQIAPPRFSLRTALSMLADSVVQLGFSFFDFVLTLGVIVCIREGCGHRHCRT